MGGVLAPDCVCVCGKAVGATMATAVAVVAAAAGATGVPASVPVESWRRKRRTVGSLTVLASILFASI